MKLKLTLKLILPSLIIWSALFSAFNFYWMPKILDSEKVSYIKQLKDQLQLLAESIVPPFSDSDLGNVYAAIDNVLQNRPTWNSLLLKDVNNKQIYPITKTEEKIEEDLIKVDFYHNDPGEPSLSLNLKVNPSTLYDRQNALISEFHILFLITFIIAIGSSYIIQKRLVINPINKLLDATKKIAKQDFSVELPHKSSDEIGNLTQSFSMMKMDLQNFQEQLKHAKNKAEESLQVKSQFLTNMSHELKTPLNIILGHSQLLHRDVKNNKPADIEDIHSISLASEHLNILIEDILTMSKIDNRQTTLHLENFSLNSLITEITNSFHPLFEQKNNHISIIFDKNIDMIRGDKTKIRHIFYNLITNANKFTSNGNISIETRTTIENNKRYFQVFVSDTGIGISEKEQKIIFKPFFQIDSSLNRKYEGTGLGLAISEGLCTIMQGTMNVQSEPKKGSTFSFCLPMELDNQISEIEQSNELIYLSGIQL